MFGCMPSASQSSRDLPRGKKSVCLDLRQPGDRDRLKRMIAAAVGVDPDSGALAVPVARALGMNAFAAMHPAQLPVIPHDFGTGRS